LDRYVVGWCERQNSRTVLKGVSILFSTVENSLTDAYLESVLIWVTIGNTVFGPSLNSPSWRNFPSLDRYVLQNAGIFAPVSAFVASGLY
jgi:hypothetical protein